MINLLVVDSHPIICKGLELSFKASRNIKFIGSLDNGLNIVEFLKQNPVDVILSEIDLPKLNGLTALRQVKVDFPKVKILIYSAQPEAVYALSSIKAGAHGFISKTASITTLKHAIIAVNTDGRYLSEALTQHLNKKSKGLKESLNYKKLSTRELEVLKLLISGMRNKDIAKELVINEKTVSTYRARLMKKLNAENLIDLVNQSKNIEL